jgi:hypothetical protein
MIKFIWDTEAPAVNDAHALEWAEEAFKSGKEEIHFCQEVLVEAIRVYMIRNDISRFDVVFIYNGHTIQICDSYTLSDWPKGFCSYHEDLLVELLKWQHGYYQKKKATDDN